MRFAALLFTALALAVPASAQDQAPAETAPITERVAEQPPEAAPAAPVTDYNLARKRLEDCPGEKFVFAWGAGANPTRVTLCSDKGASNERIVAMLEDAANKLEKTTGLPDDRRLALVEQIRAKAKEVSSRPEGSAPLAVAVPSGPAIGRSAPAKPDSVVTAPVRISGLPPLPKPIASKPAESAGRPLLPAPRLDLECITPGEFAGGAPCVTIARDSVLIVESRDSVPESLALRFYRDGDHRAEVVLGAMRKGQSRRFRVPGPVCKGVLTAEVDIRVVRGGQVVTRKGPFLLRC